MNTKKYINTYVTVIVDRKLGSIHPNHKNIIYELNYGYIPNTISGDNEEIDAYILDETNKIDTYYGKVIAIIHRLNDNDDKLIVANKDYTDEEIRKLTFFQEKYFKSIIIR